MCEQAYLSLNIFNGYDVACAYKDGAENNREQMMKDAVNAIVCKNISNELRVNSVAIPDNHPSGIKFGDDVKIIIIKEAEE